MVRLRERLRLHDGARSAELGRSGRRRHPALRDPQSCAQRRSDRIAADEPGRTGRERRGIRARFALVRCRRGAARRVRRDRLRPPRRRRVDGRELLRRGRDGRVPLRAPRGRARLGCVDGRAAGQAPRVRRGVPGRQRRHPALHHDRERRARPGSAACRSGGHPAELPRLLLRHLPRCDVREAVPGPRRTSRARRRRRPGDSRTRRRRHSGHRLRVRAARLHGRLPRRQRLPVPWVRR